MKSKIRIHAPLQNCKVMKSFFLICKFKTSITLLRKVLITWVHFSGFSKYVATFGLHFFHFRPDDNWSIQSKRQQVIFKLVTGNLLYSTWVYIATPSEINRTSLNYRYLRFPYMQWWCWMVSSALEWFHFVHVLPKGNLIVNMFVNIPLFSWLQTRSSLCWAVSSSPQL